MARKKSHRMIGSLAIGIAVLVSACNGGPSEEAAGDGGPSERLAERIAVVAAHIDAWRSASTIEDAWAAAEAAANHIVGPEGPGFGDRDADGDTRGPSDAGILPGLDGEPGGFALQVSGPNECLLRDVLGGPWVDSRGRWQEMAVAIEEWNPSNNTMPSLASHPMRIVGWATFTLSTDSLELAHEFAGHARLHADISRQALDCTK